MCSVHRLQPLRNFLDSQGFDSYVKGQGLPKWSPIVCQGSGQKSALTAFLYSGECCYDTKLPSELLSKCKKATLQSLNQDQ